MPEQEKIDLYIRLKEGMKRATRQMLERKVKLGEPVVVADSDGMPLVISAEEALRRFNKEEQ